MIWLRTARYRWRYVYSSMTFCTQERTRRFSFCLSDFYFILLQQSPGEFFKEWNFLFWTKFCCWFGVLLCALHAVLNHWMWKQCVQVFCHPLLLLGSLMIGCILNDLPVQTLSSCCCLDVSCKDKTVHVFILSSSTLTHARFSVKVPASVPFPSSL